LTPPAKNPGKTSARDRSQPTLVYGLFGPDVCRREEFLNQLRKEILPPGDTINFESYSAKEGGLAEAINAARTLPFGAARKIVLIRELNKRTRNEAEDEDKDEDENENKNKNKNENKAKDENGFSSEEIARLEKYLSCPNPSTILVLEGTKAPAAKLSTLLKEVGEWFDAKLLNERQMQDWLTGKAREAGRGFSGEAAQVIAERVGSDLALAAQELEKVLLYTDAKTIPAETVRKILSGGSSVGNWDFSNAICARDLPEAIKSLNRLLATGNPPVMIVGQLAGIIRRLLRTRLLLDQKKTEAEIGKILKITKPFALQCRCRDARAYTQAEIRRGLADLSKLDLKLKTKSSSVSPHLRLEMFLVGFVSGKSARSSKSPIRK